VSLKDRQKEGEKRGEEKEEYVGSYWMTSKKLNYTEK